MIKRFKEGLINALFLLVILAGLMLAFWGYYRVWVMAPIFFE